MGSLAKKIRKSVAALAPHPTMRLEGRGPGYVRVSYVRGGPKPGRYTPAELQIHAPGIDYVIVVANRSGRKAGRNG